MPMQALQPNQQRPAPRLREGWARVVLAQVLQRISSANTALREAAALRWHLEQQIRELRAQQCVRRRAPDTHDVSIANSEPVSAASSAGRDSSNADVPMHAQTTQQQQQGMRPAADSHPMHADSDAMATHADAQHQESFATTLQQLYQEAQVQVKELRQQRSIWRAQQRSRATEAAAVLADRDSACAALAAALVEVALLKAQWQEQQQQPAVTSASPSNTDISKHGHAVVLQHEPYNGAHLREPSQTAGLARAAPDTAETGAAPMPHAIAASSAGGDHGQQSTQFQQQQQQQQQQEEQQEQQQLQACYNQLQEEHGALRQRHEQLLAEHQHAIATNHQLQLERNSLHNTCLVVQAELAGLHDSHAQLLSSLGGLESLSDASASMQVEGASPPVRSVVTAQRSAGGAEQVIREDLPATPTPMQREEAVSPVEAVVAAQRSASNAAHVAGEELYAIPAFMQREQAASPAQVMAAAQHSASDATQAAGSNTVSGQASSRTSGGTSTAGLPSMQASGAQAGVEVEAMRLQLHWLGQELATLRATHAQLQKEHQHVLLSGARPGDDQPSSSSRGDAAAVQDELVSQCVSSTAAYQQLQEAHAHLQHSYMQLQAQNEDLSMALYKQQPEQDQQQQQLKQQQQQEVVQAFTQLKVAYEQRQQAHDHLLLEHATSHRSPTAVSEGVEQPRSVEQLPSHSSRQAAVSVHTAGAEPQVDWSGARSRLLSDCAHATTSSINNAVQQSTLQEEATTTGASSHNAAAWVTAAGGSDASRAQQHTTSTKLSTDFTSHAPAGPCLGRAGDVQAAPIPAPPFTTASPPDVTPQRGPRRSNGPPSPPSGPATPPQGIHLFNQDVSSMHPSLPTATLGPQTVTFGQGTAPINPLPSSTQPQVQQESCCKILLQDAKSATLQVSASVALQSESAYSSANITPAQRTPAPAPPESLETSFDEEEQERRMAATMRHLQSIQEEGMAQSPGGLHALDEGQPCSWQGNQEDGAVQSSCGNAPPPSREAQGSGPSTRSTLDAAQAPVAGASHTPSFAPDAALPLHAHQAPLVGVFGCSEEAESVEAEVAAAPANPREDARTSQELVPRQQLDEALAVHAALQARCASLEEERTARLYEQALLESHNAALAQQLTTLQAMTRSAWGRQAAACQTGEELGMCVARLEAERAGLEREKAVMEARSEALARQLSALQAESRTAWSTAGKQAAACQTDEELGMNAARLEAAQAGLEREKMVLEGRSEALARQLSEAQAEVRALEALLLARQAMARDAAAAGTAPTKAGFFRQAVEDAEVGHPAEHRAKDADQQQQQQQELQAAASGVNLWAKAVSELAVLKAVTAAGEGHWQRQRGQQAVQEAADDATAWAKTAAELAIVRVAAAEEQQLQRQQQAVQDAADDATAWAKAAAELAVVRVAAAEEQQLQRQQQAVQEAAASADATAWAKTAAELAVFRAVTAATEEQQQQRQRQQQAELSMAQDAAAWAKTAAELAVVRVVAAAGEQQAAAADLRAWAQAAAQLAVLNIVQSAGEQEQQQQRWLVQAQQSSTTDPSAWAKAAAELAVLKVVQSAGEQERQQVWLEHVQQSSTADLSAWAKAAAELAVLKAIHLSTDQDQQPASASLTAWAKAAAELAVLKATQSAGEDRCNKDHQQEQSTCQSAGEAAGNVRAWAQAVSELAVLKAVSAARELEPQQPCQPTDSSAPAAAAKGADGPGDQIHAAKKIKQQQQQQQQPCQSADGAVSDDVEGRERRAPSSTSCCTTLNTVTIGAAATEPATAAPTATTMPSPSTPAIPSPATPATPSPSTPAHTSTEIAVELFSTPPRASPLLSSSRAPSHLYSHAYSPPVRHPDGILYASSTAGGAGTAGTGGSGATNASFTGSSVGGSTVAGGSVTGGGAVRGRRVSVGSEASLCWSEAGSYSGQILEGTEGLLEPGSGIVGVSAAASRAERRSYTALEHAHTELLAQVTLLEQRMLRLTAEHQQQAADLEEQVRKGAVRLQALESQLAFERHTAEHEAQSLRQQLKRAKEVQAKSLQQLRDTHAAELSALRGRQAKEAEAAKAAREAEADEAKKTRDATEAEMERARDTRKAEEAQEVEVALQQALQLAHEQHAVELQRLLVQLHDAHAGELDQLQQLHTQQLSQLQQAHAGELDLRQQQLSHLQQEREQHLSHLQQEHVQQLSHLQQEHAQHLGQLQQVHEQQLSQLQEEVRAQGLAQGAQQHSERRLATEVQAERERADALMTQAARAEEEVVRVRAEKRALQRQLVTAEAEVEEAGQQLAELRFRLEHALHELAACRAGAAMSQQRLLAMEREVEEVRRPAALAQRCIQQLHAACTASATQAQAERERAALVQCELETAKERLAAHAEMANGAAGYLGPLQQDLTTAMDQVAQLERALAKLETEALHHHSHSTQLVHHLREQLAEAEAKSNTLAGQVEVTRHELQRLTHLQQRCDACHVCGSGQLSRPKGLGSGGPPYAAPISAQPLLPHSLPTVARTLPPHALPIVDRLQTEEYVQKELEEVLGAAGLRTGLHLH